jgi:hypothetical protein
MQQAQASQRAGAICAATVLLVAEEWGWSAGPSVTSRPLFLCPSLCAAAAADAVFRVSHVAATLLFSFFSSRSARAGRLHATRCAPDCTALHSYRQVQRYER